MPPEARRGLDRARQPGRPFAAPAGPIRAVHSGGQVGSLLGVPIGPSSASSSPPALPATEHAMRAQMAHAYDGAAASARRYDNDLLANDWHDHATEGHPLRSANCVQDALSLGAGAAGIPREALARVADEPSLSALLERGERVDPAQAGSRFGAGDLAVVGWPFHHTGAALGGDSFSSFTSRGRERLTGAQLRESMVPRTADQLVESIRGAREYGINAANRLPPEHPDHIADIGVARDHMGAVARSVELAARDARAHPGATDAQVFATARAAFTDQRPGAVARPLRTIQGEVMNPSLRRVARAAIHQGLTAPEPE